MSIRARIEVDGYSKSLTGVLDSAEYIWFPFFFPSECLVEIGSLRGWHFFERFCDLGFHGFALLNGPGALGATEECAAECFWKATAGKQPGDMASMFTPFLSQPHGPAAEGTVTHADHVWKRGVSGCSRPIKTSRLMERGQNAHGGLGEWHEDPPSTTGQWFPTRNLEFPTAKLQTITRKVWFSLISRINMKIPSVPFLGRNPVKVTD